MSTGAVSTGGMRSHVAGLVVDNNWDAAEQEWIVNLLLARFGGDWTVETDVRGRPGLLLPGGVSVEGSELRALARRVTLGLEDDAGTRDSHGRFDEQGTQWDVRRPVVDDAAARLAIRLTEAGVSIPKKEPSLRVVLTHDIDWVTPWEPVALAKSLLHLANPRRRWLSIPQACSRNVFLRAVDKVLDLEAQAGASSWFFMLAGPYRPLRFGSRYNCRWRSARRMAESVRSAGSRIGLHSSYLASETRCYVREAAYLGECLGEPVRAHRSHYLRFDREHLWGDLEESGIVMDSSVGFPSGLGFRAGLATPYRPYRPDRARPARILELPLVFMDRPGDIEDPERCLRDLADILERAWSVGGSVSVLVHPEALAVDARWVDLYRRILALCRDLGADLTGSIPVDAI